MRRWRAENRERHRELSRQSYARRREQILEQAPAQHRRKKYGLSEADYQAMLRGQDGRCAICRADRKLYVDHDHQTGRVRGLLCNRCNTGLPILEEPDRLSAAQAYLATT